MNELKEKLAAASGKRSIRSYFESEGDRKDIIRLAVTLLIITAVSAALLGFVHYQTEPIIQARTQEKTEEAMHSVLEADYYRDLMSYEPGDHVTAISQAIDGGLVTGYVCQVESNGFGGAMSLVVGVDLDGAVTGVAVINHGETENIGTKVVENESVLNDLVGLHAPVIMKSGEEGFDAVSGATYSANGVLLAVNAALDAVAVYEQEGGA